MSSTCTSIGRKLTHHSKPSYLHGLLKVHKEGFPLRPIINSRNSPTPKIGAISFFINPNTRRKVIHICLRILSTQNIFKQIQIRPRDYLVNFDIKSLYIKLP